MEITIDTTVTYRNIQNSNYKIIHNIGGTRSGKTYAALQYCIVEAIRQKSVITIVRRTVPALKRTIIKDFKDIMQSLGIWNDSNWNSSDRQYTLSNGSLIQFINTDDEQKLRGIKSDILLCDEANEIEESAFFQLKIRTSGKVILCYNPTVSPYHWLRQMGNCDRYITTYRDNPFLEESIINEIQNLKFTNEKYYKIYALGEYVQNDKLIYSFEIVDSIPICDLVGYGLDFGFSNDPTAMVAVYKNGDNLYMQEVIYKRGLLSNELINFIQSYGVGQTEIWCDSSDPRLIEELHRSGLNAKAVKKGPDSIRFGIQILQNYKINILKESVNLINEIYSYEYGTDKYGDVTNVPVDSNNHLLDAMRYVGMMRLSKIGERAGTYKVRIGLDNISRHVPTT